MCRWCFQTIFAVFNQQMGNISHFRIQECFADRWKPQISIYWTGCVLQIFCRRVRLCGYIVYNWNCWSTVFFFPEVVTLDQNAWSVERFQHPPFRKWPWVCVRCFPLLGKKTSDSLDIQVFWVETITQISCYVNIRTVYCHHLLCNRSSYNHILTFAKA